MKFKFRGIPIFEYLPNSIGDKVIQHKIYPYAIPGFDYCNMRPEDYNLLSNFFDTVYRHIQGENIELKDIEIF